MKHRYQKLKTQNQNQEIKRLKRALSEQDRALARERRENARLKRQLSEAKGVYGAESDGEFSLGSRKKTASGQASEWADLLDAGRVNAKRFSKKSYFRYLIQTVKESTLGLIIRRVSRYLRRLRLIRTVAAIVSAILVALLFSAVFIAALPFLILVTLSALAAVLFRAAKANRLMKHELSGKHIRVIIAPDTVTFQDGTFFERSAEAMAAEPDTAVLVVTPHLLSTRGLGGKGMFFTVRKEQEDLYLVRRAYFFILRRRVLDCLDKEITFMY